MKQFSVSEKAIRIWKIRLYFILILLSVIGGILFAIYIPLGVFYQAAVVFLFFFAWLWFLPRRIRSHRITIGEDAVMSERGVFVKTVYVMPYPRLLYAQLFSTPLSRYYKLQSIHLKAARGIIILPHLEAREIAEILSLIEQRGE